MKCVWILSIETKKYIQCSISSFIPTSLEDYLKKVISSKRGIDMSDLQSWTVEKKHYSFRSSRKLVFFI